MDDISRIHVESFNHMIDEGDNFIELSLENIEIQKPSIQGSNIPLYPHECRRAGWSYGSRAYAQINVRFNGASQGVIDIYLGEIPIMVKSKLCSLYNIPKKELPGHFEEEDELGGYFIVNGRERILRLLVAPRKNFPMSIKRPSFKKKGEGFTEHAIALKSVREDEMTSLMMMHWRTIGEPMITLVVMNQQFFIPFSFVIRALTDKTEKDIFYDMRRGGNLNLSLEEAALCCVMNLKDPKLSSQESALRYLGQTFRKRIRANVSKSDVEIGKDVVNRYIVIHTPTWSEKHHMLCFMFRKLHAIVSNECCVESNENTMFQELITPANLYINLLRDRIMVLLRAGIETIIYDARKKKVTSLPRLSSIQSSLVRRGEEVAQYMNYFLSTGNFPALTYYLLPAMFNGQSAGISVPLDNINFLRSAAMFRSIHRGATYNDMRTTDVRKLMPEAYGFICPVHTPDGAPCGLLNHLAEPVQVVTEIMQNEKINRLAKWLSTNRLRSVEYVQNLVSMSELTNSVVVMLDGRILGWCPSSVDAKKLEVELRAAKIGHENCKAPEDLLKLVPFHMEIILVLPTEAASQFPGLFLFTGNSRLIRPVHNLLRTKGVLIKERTDVEWIGTFEQAYLDIPVSIDELNERPIEMRTHMEISPEMLFSVVASFTPYPDFNQSPRNMYQCQMIKQSMGHASYTWRYRSDAKAYRLLEVQKPMVRTKTYDKYEMEKYPIGFNAIVAVISYTGYDMEDAMIINKSSYDRGFANACIYKSEFIDLTFLLKKEGQIIIRKKTEELDFECPYKFGLIDGKEYEGIQKDGFPPIGQKLKPHESFLYAYHRVETGQTKVILYEGNEPAYVECVSLNGSQSKATITLRVERRPDIGDKYSSRHGQKGINSILLPRVDMPWSIDSGMVPDIIFNPHGFPTRMTIGMMVEFIAGKSAAIYGKKIDCTAFRTTEDNPPYYEYAEDLKRAGYNYWGTETLISGTTGKQIEAEIFIGMVYYQRLRHMVADKYQVRSTGRFDPVLRQPLKGRKVQGGMRLGEMERDCLLSHGIVFSLQDRFFDSNCDRVTVIVCRRCKSLVHTETLKEDQDKWMHKKNQIHINKHNVMLYRCRFCNTESLMNTQSLESKGSAQNSSIDLDENEGEEERRRRQSKLPRVIDSKNISDLRVIEVTAAFRYLTYELSLMNIRTKLEFEE